MKAFFDYQHLDGEIMSDRDEKEVNSKFWNVGKWENFIKPFLKEGGTLVDMGSNAGLFLKLAEDMGFKAIGVDSDKEAVARGLAWRDKNKGKYQILCTPMEECIDLLPMADYTVLANSHYYFYIADWLDYLDELRFKTRYCIIVTTEKRNSQISMASADPDAIRSYFMDWEDVGFIDALPTEGDPSPRKLYGMCFKSQIERVPMNLDCGNHVQDKFYEELDTGKEFSRTKYYKILKGYRKKWSEEELNLFILNKISLFNSVKKNGQLRPVIVGENNRVLDGNHLYSIMNYLGYDNCFIRRV